MTSIHQSVGYWASLLARSMEAEFGRRLAPFGLTRMSYAVLGAIAFDGKSTPTSIADFLGLDRATVTRLLDRLEARNLIERDRSLSDRRSVSIIVKPEGEALAKELQAHSRAVNAQFTADLKTGDVESFVELVKAMLAQTEEPLESL
jgi:DNA-binding MarR family transcriptional regulator